VRDRWRVEGPAGGAARHITKAEEAQMRSTHLTPAAALLAAALVALALAAPAGAATYRISGRQIAVDEDAGKFKMSGSLVGDWNITKFDIHATSPLVQAAGTETFDGCLDLRRNGCGRRDPNGTLTFSLTYEALFASPDPSSLVWGSCRHPIVAGTGGFARAKGVVAMVDTPTRSGVRTDYIGNVTLPGTAGRDRGARARAAAVTAGGCG
jgi:hypothetical protein